MIPVEESAEYDVGFEISRIAGMLRSIQDELDNPKMMDTKAIRSRIDTILDTLLKIHNRMAVGWLKDNQLSGHSE